MKAWIARFIAYLFLGSFCIAGPVLLVVALTPAVQRAALIYTGLRAEGTVVAKRSMGSTRVTYSPVVRFKAGDGRPYTVISDVYGKESAFSFGARLDDFAALWTSPLVTGVVGAGFSVIPAIVLLAWLRRRAADGEAGTTNRAHVVADAVSRGLRGALGLVLSGAGIVFMAVGLGIVLPDSSSVKDSRVLIIGTSVLLMACGVQVGQWAAREGRVSRAMGGHARRVDLHGHTVIPGIVDSHMHLLYGAIALHGLNLSTPQSSITPDQPELLAQRLRDTPPRIRTMRCCSGVRISAPHRRRRPPLRCSTAPRRCARSSFTTPPSTRCG